MDNKELMSKVFEFLLEEYKELNNSLHINEEKGEKRIEFFLTLSTVVLGAIALFIKEFSEIDPKLLILTNVLIIILLAGLISISIIIKNRLEKRNRTTDGLKKDIAEIRRIIKENIDIMHEILPADYSAFVNRKQESSSTLDRKWTSLAHIALVMTCVLIGVTSAFLLHAFNVEERNLVVTTGLITLVAAIFFTFKK